MGNRFGAGAGVSDGPHAAELEKSGPSRKGYASFRRMPIDADGTGKELPKPVNVLLSELGVSLPDGKPLRFGDRIFWTPPEAPELHGLKVLRPGLELAELILRKRRTI